MRFTLDMKNRTETGQWNKQGTAVKLGKDDVRYWKSRLKKRSYKSGGKTVEIKEWQVRLFSGSSEEWFNLGTQNQAAAARQARDIYLHLRANGMAETVARFKAKPQEETKVSTLGEYIEAVDAQCTLTPETLYGYARKARQIVGEILNIPHSPKKYDYVNGGQGAWRKKVDSFKLENLTTAKINAWKKRYVEKAGTDPLKRKRAESTANSCLRNSKALFGKKIIRQLSGLILPDEIPFREVEYFRQSASRYRSKVNIEALIKQANDELQGEEPEQFKIFILAIFVGLRRKEIDMLLWSAFDWERSIIRIQPTEYHGLKSDASADDVPVEPEVMALFKAFHEEAVDEEFVIRSDRAPKISKSYRYYRAEKEFKALLDWLRANGVEAIKPIHTLRKEFGRLITEQHGIFAASKLLRHSSIQVTASFYADDTRHLTVGLGKLVKS